LESFHSKTSENKPKFQGPERSTERHLPVSVVNHSTCNKAMAVCSLEPLRATRKSQTCVSLLCSQELRGNVQRIIKWISIPDPECGTTEVGETPLKFSQALCRAFKLAKTNLVKIGAKRVGKTIDGRKLTLLSVFGECEGHPSPSCVDMEPNRTMIRHFHP